jgi:hypothetical protein
LARSNLQKSRAPLALVRSTRRRHRPSELIARDEFSFHRAALPIPRASACKLRCAPRRLRASATKPEAALSVLVEGLRKARLKERKPRLNFIVPRDAPCFLRAQISVALAPASKDAPGVQGQRRPLL